MRKSNSEPFYALHLLYAPPVNRGNVCLLEDFPIVNNLKVTVNIPEQVKEVVTAPDGENIPFKWENGKLSFTVDNLRLHKLIVIKF